LKPQLETILHALRAAFEDIYGTHLVNLMLYGSQARHEGSDESDIDVLVVLSGAVNPGAEIARTGSVTASLSLQYDVVISCVFIPEEHFRNGQSPLLRNIRREGIPI
jgi:predicted nucleotidyltransferase